MDGDVSLITWFVLRPGLAVLLLRGGEVLTLAAPPFSSEQDLHGCAASSVGVYSDHRSPLPPTVDGPGETVAEDAPTADEAGYRRPGAGRSMHRTGVVG